MLQRYDVAPARERGLKYQQRSDQQVKAAVAPARERGLKFDVKFNLKCIRPSLPRGSVD